MEELFWADQLAKEIRERNRYKYLEKDIPKFDKFVVKTSAGASGVLHIGRLSDTIRSESAFRALENSGVRAEFIWVAEDMDPLRKVPQDIPKNYIDFIGFPVTDIPDPWGCHKSYGEHHLSRYFEVLDKFVATKMIKFSMREEYKKGNFKQYIKAILDNLDLVIEIQNKYRTNPLKSGWSPWTPICKNCGKIITPKIMKFEKEKIHYVCQDYEFEKTTAKGCNYEGVADPLKDPGKLMWKGEWAAQWARWEVVSEGAGKEYQVPLSAFWVNAEICEKIFNFPSPVPIFYEHLMIDGKKMSASLGNVVYPDEWLSVAGPELLRYFYNKKLMKTRSFSWGDLPRLYEEYDKAEDIFFDKIKLENEKEKAHVKRLFEIAQIKKPVKHDVHIPFDFASMIAQLMPGGKLEKALELLKTTGHVEDKLKERDRQEIEQRLNLAKTWADKFAPEEFKIRLSDKTNGILEKLNSKQKSALNNLANILRREDFTEKSLYMKLFDVARKNDLEPKDLFKAAYLVLIGKEFGPRLAPFILTIGKEDVAKKFSGI